MSLGIARTASWAAWMSQEGNRSILDISLGPKQTCVGDQGHLGENEMKNSVKNEPCLGKSGGRNRTGIERAEFRLGFGGWGLGCEMGFAVGSWKAELASRS